MVKVIHYDGWTNDTYMFLPSTGLVATKFNVKLTILNELKKVRYEVNNSTTLF